VVEDAAPAWPDDDMQKLKVLWAGHLPLEIAFWQYAIFYGVIFNVVATAVALFLVVLDAPIAIAIVVHLLPVPYSVLTMVGVWRSADHYPGPANTALLAKATVVAWSALWVAF
jgi:hypothetical protein